MRLVPRTAMDPMLLLFVTATSIWASVVAGGPPRGEPPFVSMEPEMKEH